MIKKTLIRTYFFLFAFFILMIVFYASIDPYFIGLISIEQPFDYSYTAIWDFSDLDDYNYDNSLIEADSNGAGLKLTRITYEWQEEVITSYNVEKALYNQGDKTDKIKSVDSNKLQVNKGNIFDVFFENQIDNDYIILMHLKDSNPSDIYLCD